MKPVHHLLKFGFGLGLLLFIFHHIPFDKVIDGIFMANVNFIICALCVVIFSVLLNAIRWKWLLTETGHTAPLTDILTLSFIALFFNIYFPGGVVGDITKSVTLSNRSVSEKGKWPALSSIFASVITDRLLGFYSLAALVLMGIIIQPQAIGDKRIMALALSVIIGFIFLTMILFGQYFRNFFSRIKFLSKLKTIQEALWVYRNKWEIFPKVFLISLGSNLCMILSFYLTARAVQVDIPLYALFHFVPLIELISELPISQGGIGIRETATLTLLSTVGIDAPQALAISLLIYSLLLIIGAMGGALFVHDRYRRRFALAS